MHSRPHRGRLCAFRRVECASRVREYRQKLAEIAAPTDELVADLTQFERNAALIAVAVDTVGDEWRELGEHIPEATDTSVTGGLKERIRARGAVREMVLALRQIDMAARRGGFDAAAEAYADYRAQVAPISITLAAAEPFSLFDAGYGGSISRRWRGRPCLRSEAEYETL